MTVVTLLLLKEAVPIPGKTASGRMQYRTGEDRLELYLDAEGRGVLMQRKVNPEDETPHYGLVPWANIKGVQTGQAPPATLTPPKRTRRTR